MVVVVAIGAGSDSLGINPFAALLTTGWLLLVGYSVLAALRNPSARRDVARLVVLPGSVSLLLATLVGITGLTPAGLGQAWSTNSLVLGALVTAGAFALTRTLLNAPDTTS